MASEDLELTFQVGLTIDTLGPPGIIGFGTHPNKRWIVTGYTQIQQNSKVFPTDAQVDDVLVLDSINRYLYKGTTGAITNHVFEEYRWVGQTDSDYTLFNPQSGFLFRDTKLSTISIRTAVPRNWRSIS